MTLSGPYSLISMKVLAMHWRTACELFSQRHPSASCTYSSCKLFSGPNLKLRVCNSTPTFHSPVRGTLDPWNWAWERSWIYRFLFSLHWIRAEYTHERECRRFQFLCFGWPTNGSTQNWLRPAAEIVSRTENHPTGLCSTSPQVSQMVTGLMRWYYPSRPMNSGTEILCQVAREQVTYCPYQYILPLGYLLVCIGPGPGRVRT